MMNTATLAFPNSNFLSLLADSVTRARTLEELVRPLLELLQSVTDLESTYLTTIDSGAGFQYILFSRNTSRMQIPEGLSVPWEGTLCKRALEEGKPYTDDVANCWADSGPARELGIATYVSTPVRTEDGTLYGTLCGASSERKPLADGAERVLSMFSRLIGQQIDRERMVQALRHANDSLALSALTDATTGLPNRRALMEEMKRRRETLAQRGDELVAAFIDLDRFKAINDRYGHEIGDRFLAAIGERLRGALRSDDFVARLGGDEFVTLSSGTRGDRAAIAAAMHSRLFAATSGRYAFDGVVIDYAGPSIGIAIAGTEEEPDALLARADTAMYADKQERKLTATTH